MEKNIEPPSDGLLKKNFDNGLYVDIATTSPIPHTAELNRYRVIISAESPESAGALLLAAQTDAVKNATGEDLVKAVIQAARGVTGVTVKRGPVFSIFCTDDHFLPTFNGPNGEPACEVIDKAGQVLRREFRQDCLLHDGPNGEPSLQKFDSAGTLIHAERQTGRFASDIKILSAQEREEYMKKAAETKAITKLKPAIKTKPMTP